MDGSISFVDSRGRTRDIIEEEMAVPDVRDELIKSESASIATITVDHTRSLEGVSPWRDWFLGIAKRFGSVATANTVSSRAQRTIDDEDTRKKVAKS